MNKQFLNLMTVCAACVALGAQGQSSSGVSGSSSADPNAQSGWTSRQLSPTGRMGQQEIKASQLNGAQLMGSTGSQLGTISDCIINPFSGRIDFAVVSLNSTGSTSSSGISGSTGSTASSGSSPATTSSASGKQVVVPWVLLRASSMAGGTSATPGSTMQQSFVFNGDPMKLQSAPNFDATTDLSQPTWRHSVFAYFGLSGIGSATGGAESPGGSSSGRNITPDYNTSGNPK